MLEEWRPVYGHERGYAVSDQGRVWSHKRHRYLRPRYEKRPGNRQGYWRLSIYRADGRDANRSIHTLVLEAFVGPRPAGLEGAHLDGDTDNNALSNLVWATAKENYRHRILHGTTTIGERNNLVKVPDTTALAVIEAVAGGMSRRQAARVYGVGAQTACDWVSSHSPRWAILMPRVSALELAV